MRSLVSSSLLAGFLAGVLAVAGCGVSPPDDCRDGRDNDGDGRIDAADPACAAGGEGEAPDPAQCADGVDNDNDGRMDYPADPGCTAADDTDELDTDTACNNDLDDDGDLLIDSFDPGCTGPQDDDEVNPALCGDGVDNDGDTRADWPTDPGCSAPDDSDETDPVPPPACANNADDDGDGAVDYPADPGCSSAGDADEYNTIQGACGVGETPMVPMGGVVMGSFPSPKPNVLSSPLCSGQGGEQGYKLVIPPGPPVSLLVSTDFPETTLDTVIYVRRMCKDAGTELGCDDDGGDVGAGGSASKLLLQQVTPGDLYVVVDSFGASSIGTYKLEVSPRVPLHEVCTVGGTECEPGLICREVTPGAGFTCEPHLCGDTVDNDGDGKTDYPSEPGCDSLLDDDEADPATPPVCANDADDDADGVKDWPSDPGCDAASDSSETDECVPGVLAPLYVGPTAGNVATTMGQIDPPGGCVPAGQSGTEQAFRFELTRPVARLDVSTVGSVADTVVYLRESECDDPGPLAWCDDDGGGSGDSLLQLTGLSTGRYFVIVDGKTFTGGAFTLSITGNLALGDSCTPADPIYVCGPGLACHAGVCETAQCADGADNDGDMKSDAADPGCLSDSDDDETDPATPPVCADGADNDGDMLVDYPADPGCLRASDDNEQQCAHDICQAGVALTASCDACVATICAVDPFCCSTSWDSLCVGEVASECGLTCP
jgi:hypothetical protein